MDHVEATGPEAAVWIDDQLGYEAEAQSWVRLLGRRMLALSPDPRRGISAAELESVRSFLAGSLF